VLFRSEIDAERVELDVVRGSLVVERGFLVGPLEELTRRDLRHSVGADGLFRRRRCGVRHGSARQGEGTRRLRLGRRLSPSPLPSKEEEEASERGCDQAKAGKREPGAGATGG